MHSNDKDPKFKVGYHVRISEYKNIFAKRYTENWSEEVKNTVPWNILWKGTTKTNQQEFRIQKVIKRKGDEFISNGKVVIVHLIAGLIKKT